MKVRVLVYILLIYLVLLLQTNMLEAVRVFGVKPNLFLLLIVSIAILRGNVEGAVLGFFIGLSQDMAGGRYLGFYAILGMYLGFLTGSVNKRMYKENYLVIVFFTLISTVFYEGTVYLLDNLIHNISSAGTGTELVQAEFLWAFRYKIVPEFLLNCFVMLPVYALMMRLDGFINRFGHSYNKY